MKQPVLYGTGGGGGSWVQTIAVKAPNGASITVSGGGETLTGTGTGSYYAFSVHNQSTQYTINVSMPASVGGASAPAQTETTGTSSGVISFKEFKFATITTSVTQDYEGVAVTCVSGGTTLTITPAVGTSSITFRVPSTGNWVISGVVSGTTYYASPNPVVISSLDDTETANLATRPDGKTVTPTDSIATWLACGGVSESYTALAEVLADHETLAILITDHNAVDYMVRSTTWVTDVCSDATAMRYIGRRNYCADTLLDDADWSAGICNSDYFESVLNKKVPKMTATNLPSGEVLYLNQNNSYPAWQAFDDNDSTKACASGVFSTPGYYIGYKFTEPVRVMKLKQLMDTGATITYKLQYSDDNGSTWKDAGLQYSGSQYDGTITKDVSNSISSDYWRILSTAVSTSNQFDTKTLQFYGRADVDETKIAIYGAASDSDIYYLNSGSPVNVGSTNTSGFGEISRSDLPNGTYTLYSSVAKDPSNLSNDYSKSVVVDSNTIEIMLMPDGALYWFGYIDDNLETVKSANGWTLTDGSTYDEPTMSTIYFDTSSSTSHSKVKGTKNKIVGASTAYALVECVTYYSGNCGYMRKSSIKESINDGTQTNILDDTNLAKYSLDLSSVTSGAYIVFGTTSPSTATRGAKWYAIWYE